MTDIIGVIGSGTMGNGIAQVAARAGYNVVVRDVTAEFIERGMKAIDRNLQRDVDKERLSSVEKQSLTLECEWRRSSAGPCYWPIGLAVVDDDAL